MSCYHILYIITVSFYSDDLISAERKTCSHKQRIPVAKRITTDLEITGGTRHFPLDIHLTYRNVDSSIRNVSYVCVASYLEAGH